ncbi:MAG: hypothetical protein M3328_10000, partial [Chloroflexota bacterium]|nr:hypothetical protein [Chloroflexota bacterium]
MKIAFESELMENQKHAVVMAPDLAFEVLQSKEGDALFFSIGTDHVFYLTREVTQTRTGWNKLDLSSALSSQHGGAAVAAKTFSVAQNAQTQAIDLALVLTVGGADFIYLSLGNANTDAAWANGVTWSAIPFDPSPAPNPVPNPLTIADVLLMNIPGSEGNAAVENIFVDILRTPGDPLKLLDRYYIAPRSSPKWNLHVLAADLAAGSISSCLGHRTGDPLPGIYTFGTIGSEQELLFTPQYNYFRPNVAPNPTRLTVPAGASAIASALNGSGVSNLFVAGTNGLFVFTPDNQADKATPAQIVTSAFVAGASALAAATDAKRTAVWGVSPQGDLFYVACSAGSEADPNAWSNPVPLLPSVEGFAFFLNLNTGNNVLFAHVDGQNLVQLTQDPVTTDWLQRSILLPSTSPDDMAVYQSFTTHIQVTDDNGVGAQLVPVSLTATSPVSVYVNDQYHILSPGVTLNVITDIAGVMTVVQETQSLAAVCFRATLTNTPEVVADVNPMSKALTTLGTVKDGGDLGNVQVTNADGTRQSLVPSSVSSDDKDAAAKSLVQFVQIASALPPDGSPQGTIGGARLMATATAVPRSWAVSFANGGVTYHEGEEAVQLLGLRAAGTTPTLAAEAEAGPSPLGSVGSGIKVEVGDFFLWLKHAFDDVESFTVNEAEGIYHLVAKIGNEIYHVVLDSLAAIVHAVEFIFNKIKVSFEDLIKWLGFLFEWSDIVRTHKVLKNILKLYVCRVVDEIDSLEDDIKSAFAGLEQRIDSWAGFNFTFPTNTIGTSTSSSASTPGLGSPPSNWALHHTKGNVSFATTTYSPSNNGSSDLDAVIDDLTALVTGELQAIKDAINEIKTQVVDSFASLTAIEVIKKVLAIVADLIIKTVENVILRVLDLIKIVIKGLLDFLDAPIRIPILSAKYKEITDDELSFLDLACLIGAIPVTIIYKIVAGSTPYPDDSDTQSLVDAPDFATLKTLLTSDSAPKSNTPMLMTENMAVSVAPVDKASAVLDIASFFGAVPVAFFAMDRQEDSVPPLPMRCAAATCYLLYVSPNFPSAWNNP